MTELGLIIGLSIVFCAIYVFFDHYRHKCDDDTEDDLGYLQYL